VKGGAWEGPWKAYGDVRELTRFHKHTISWSRSVGTFEPAAVDLPPVFAREAATGVFGSASHTRSRSAPGVFSTPPSSSSRCIESMLTFRRNEGSPPSAGVTLRENGRPVEAGGVPRGAEDVPEEVLAGRMRSEKLDASEPRDRSGWVPADMAEVSPSALSAADITEEMYEVSPRSSSLRSGPEPDYKAYGVPRV
jgi:hypothetical protein